MVWTNLSKPFDVFFSFSQLFFQLPGIRNNDINNLPSCKASSKENGTGQYPVSVTQKPRNSKGDFRELKSKNVLREALSDDLLKLISCTLFNNFIYVFPFFRTNLFPQKIQQISLVCQQIYAEQCQKIREYLMFIALLIDHKFKFNVGCCVVLKCAKP